MIKEEVAEKPAVKEKVIDLANKISRTRRGARGEIRPDDPEYRILEPVVSDDDAEVALCLGLREPKNSEEIAGLCGKSVGETEEILYRLASDGVISCYPVNGIDNFQLELWVPGVMEFMVVNKENVKKYPQIAECFEEYSREKGIMLAGNVPPGLGVMRVIPIESTIDGETRRASYEEVSTYLDKNEIFSVSDCACRSVRESMGEGCGHLKEDMCIQLGDAAEFYIRTGRGRSISRDEAREILLKAEANGLVHQIANTDGPGNTHAICNCCSCSCLALRHATYFQNPDLVRSNYVSIVDAGKCVGCGECVENCPTNALKLGRKICGTPETAAAKNRELPSDTDWGEDRWNIEYRTNREVVDDGGTSPCKAECPAHIGIQGYIKLASQGRYTEALELIKHENPFPAVCGRICPRNCESACTRGELDDPVAIDDIKKFIAEKDLHADTRYVPAKAHDYGKKIAVVGAGPAGLSCAYYLAVDGYDVTVFEKQKVLGGMLTLGIPSFRLEKDVLNAEIEILRELGVEFRTGVEIGRDLCLDDLRDSGFEAFYIAIGAQNGRKLGIEGEDAAGVVAGVDFLRSVNLGEDSGITGKVIVIGGGNVAVDVARTAVRTEAETVEMYCLETMEQMPALKEEIEEAAEEDIVINGSWGPSRIITENGRVTGVEFMKCLSVFDSGGRFNPVFDENDVVTVDADTVLISVGQSIDWGGIAEGSSLEFYPNRTVKADSLTFQTNQPDVFAGGDALTGPKFAIDAIAAGKEGAVSIHRYVQPGQSLELGRIVRDYRPFDKENLDLESYDRLPRQKAGSTGGIKSRETFRDLRGTLTEEQIKKETERCLGCGATIADQYACVGCGVCVTKCKFDAVSLVRKYDAVNKELLEMRPAIMKNMVKRKIKITVKKPVRALKAAISGK